MSQFLVNYQYAPKLAVASKRGDVRNFFFLVRRSCLFQFSVTVFIAIALFAGSEFTLTMMGKDFEDALLITYLLLLRNVVFSLFGPVPTLLNMAGLERQMAVVNAVSAVVAILATAIIVLFTANAVYLLIALSAGDAARLPLAWLMLARSYGGPALRAAIFSSGGRRDQ
jgi:O-antigen/teichoic acid export membrane protein